MSDFFFTEPFRYSGFSQVYNGGKYKDRDKVNKIDKIMANIEEINNKLSLLDNKKNKNTNNVNNGSSGIDEITNLHKWIVAVFLGVIFFILASPMFMNITNSLIKMRPTKGFNLLTLFINTIIFILFVRIILL